MSTVLYKICTNTQNEEMKLCNVNKTASPQAQHLRKRRLRYAWSTSLTVPLDPTQTKPHKYNCAEEDTAYINISNERKTPTAKADKVSKERKPHKYNCAEEATTYKSISTERTNQGARAPLDRESAPKKREKGKDTRNKLIPKQGKQRKCPNLKGKQANAKNKKNRKRQEQKRILRLRAFYRACFVQALKDEKGLKLKFLI